MSEKCSIKTCERSTHALCHGCNTSFCREHMFEHSLTTHLQLNPLIDQVNQLQDQIKGLEQLNLSQISIQKLDGWRQQAHQLVDAYFMEKTRELEVYIAEQIKEQDQELHEIQTRIATSTREQDTTHELIDRLTYRIQTLQKNIDKILHNDFQININPLTVDKNLIVFDKSFNLTTLPPVYRVINRSAASYTSLATDNRFLLLHYEDVLVLINELLAIHKKIPWTHGPIYDMCYSSALEQFIIINEHEVFLLNAENMSINKVRSIPYQQWFSCTCSKTSLYLSTKVYSSSIVQFNLLPSMTFIKRWTSPNLCSDVEAIDGIVCHDDKLAVIISNDARKFVRMELRSATSLARIWVLLLEVVYNEDQAYRFCVVNQNEWLITDHHSSRLLHISDDGKVKSMVPYEPAPCFATKFGQDMLAVSTKTVVQFHKL